MKFCKLWICILVLSLVLCGCSSQTPTSGGVKNEASSDVHYDAESPILTEASDKTAAESLASSRKIIYRYSQTLETTDFDGFLPLLQSRVAELGGYVEASNVDNSGRSRYAWFTVRIPKSTDAAFTGFLSQNSNVISSSVQTEDVTLSYVDMESRLAAYRVEEAKLQELLEKSQDLSEILQIQDRLTQVIYEIEAYESTLRTYDNLIDYSTFSLTVREVEKETVTQELTVWQTIGNNLANGFADVGNFLVELFIFLISAIPYLLILAIPTALVVLLIKLTRRKKNKKNPA